MGEKSKPTTTNWWLARGLRPDYLALYDPLWLALRVGLQDGWLIRVGAERNLNTLRKYFQEEPSLNRAWQVLHFLDEILAGYKTNPPRETSLRNDVKVARQSIWSVYQDLFAKDNLFVIFPKEDLIGRWLMLPQTAQKKVLDNLGRYPALYNDSPHQKEIHWFMSTIKHVKGSGVEADA